MIQVRFGIVFLLISNTLPRHHNKKKRNVSNCTNIFWATLYYSAPLSINFQCKFYSCPPILPHSDTRNWAKCECSPQPLLDIA